MKCKLDKKTSIGGQAVIEGVMMRGKTAMATAVRDSDGIIRLETKRIKPANKRNLFFRLPLIRGVFAFFDSLINGTKTLMRSAEVFGESEPSKFEKWLANKCKIDVMGIVVAISLVLGLGLAVALFMFLPQFVRGGIEKIIGNGYSFSVWARNFIEGGLKLVIFLLYIGFCMLIKDVRRTFMYHGAEHKTISCYEQGKELTVENAKACKRVHDRCGTTFMVFVMVISIIVFAVFEALIGGEINNKLLRILCKIALLPVVAGLSYELLKGLSKTECFVFYPLKIPGLLLQRLTTQEPTDDMLEVAITAFNAVIEMDNDKSIKERQFVVPKKLNDLVVDVKKRLKDGGVDEEAEGEWIVSLTLNLKRNQLNQETLVSAKNIEKIDAIVLERLTGRPLWYCLGDTEFYGYNIKVDERVLIPRPETELLVMESLKYVKDNSKVLDLCTGSGAIAIALKKEKPTVSVSAVDVSNQALELAIENAQVNDVEIEFIQSDLFDKLGDKTFDVIVSNPPYIKRGDIQTLQVEVKNFEPVIALDGGVDGLDFYKKITKHAKNYLNENGVILMECGIGQAQEIVQLLKGFSKVEIIKDYEGIDRIVKAVL